MGVIQKRGVLNGQHHLMTSHPLYCALAVCINHLFRRDFRIIKETVGCLGIGPIFTGLVDRRRWLLPQVIGQFLAAAVQARIAQVDLGKFFRCPGFFFTLLLVRQIVLLPASVG